ncbi:MAG TPA: hypothetical protein VMA72_17475 [Streptosporangiaceae bacterium]|nr:hypothetical protein [Streptosporangiaceae bacterium]
MIRRGFWLLAGAALGVTGYRKATRLVQALTGQSALGGAAAGHQLPAARRPAATRAVRPGRAQPQFVPQRLAPPFAARPAQLPAKPAASKQPTVTPAARIAAAAARATAAAGFVRDVRDGMAEYWDLHRSESDRTLGSRRDHPWSGDGQQGPREH